MTTNERIKNHERAIQILEAIRSWERQILSEKENIVTFYSEFPSLKNKARNRIETLKRCIERLELIYSNITDK